MTDSTPDQPEQASAPAKAVPAHGPTSDGDFAVWLVTRAPKTVEDLTAGLKEVVTAVVETGKKGSLTLTIEVKPASKDGMADMLLISDVVTAKPPAPPRDPVGVMWAGEDGSLLDGPKAQAAFDFTGGGNR